MKFVCVRVYVLAKAQNRDKQIEQETETRVPTFSGGPKITIWGSMLRGRRGRIVDSLPHCIRIFVCEKHQSQQVEKRFRLHQPLLRAVLISALGIVRRPTNIFSARLI